MICEFEHWDRCLKGLVECDGQKMFCKILNDDEYELRPIAWDAECDEYLADYRKAYPHWFHDESKRSYDGRDLKWFSDKWQHRNPIEEKAVPQKTPQKTTPAAT